ncbi:hypothetical protein KA005_65880 [bacterium]|nr:hypothetical protein [bacterium]
MTNKIANAEGMKLQQLINMTEASIGKIDFDQIKDHLKTIQPEHKESLETAFKTRNVEAIGTLLLMSVYQSVQDEFKRELYQ